MSSTEFTEWCIFLRGDPELEVRIDWNTAHVCATMANVFCGGKGRAFEMKEYLLRFSPAERDRVSQRGLVVKLKSWLSRYVKKDVG